MQLEIIVMQLYIFATESETLFMQLNVQVTSRNIVYATGNILYVTGYISNATECIRCANINTRMERNIFVMEPEIQVINMNIFAM